MRRILLCLASALIVAGAGAVPIAPITPESIAKVLDPIFAKCSPTGTPGASVAVVYDGKIVFTKGYGVTDVDAKTPVDPEKHLFRAASVSKLITATAVMQLVEQGKVDLDTDVNTYLKPPIVPEAFGQPITLRNLLQHAAGFDDEFLGMARATQENLPSLHEYLATGLPKRVFPPGIFASYSNHGVALAGLVVEEVTGVPFAQYAKEHIFDPLGMEHSYFDLVPDANTPLARGYWRGIFGGPLQPAGYDYPLTIPASTLCTTAPDMARFMIAHLGNGGGILKPETEAAMQASGKVPGLAIGFFERWIGNWRCLSHTGLIWGYATLLMICPEEKFGIYVTMNSEDGDLYDSAAQALMRGLFSPPAEPAPYQIEATPSENAGATPLAHFYGSWYRYTRYPRNSMLKFGLLLSGRVGEFQFGPGPTPNAVEFRRDKARGGTVYYNLPGLGFTRARGKGESSILPEAGPAAFFVGFGSPPGADVFVDRSAAYERISPWERTSFLLQLAGGAGVILLSWPLGRVLARALKKDTLPSVITRSMLVYLVAMLLFAAGLGYVLGTLAPFAVAYGTPPLMWPVLCLPLLALGAWAVALVGHVRAMRRREGYFLQRLHLGLTLCAGGVLFLILNYWNLLGFHLG